MTNLIEKSLLGDETGATSAQMLATRLQAIEGGPSGYRLRRIILTNFWLYEHQIIEIPHGRLFLAGDNGSGKSTVLMAAITLALDGDHHPSRIDTFGRREKKIDYYILGGESNTPFQRDLRTSYIGLEFEWCNQQDPPFAPELRALWEHGAFEKARFLTIGLGFTGNKNNVNPITITRFLITDGTRLDSKELSTLISTPHENPHACDMKTFKKNVSEHGILCAKQTEYAQKVAQYLFNFPKPEDLSKLTKQLLYLRQPNLNSVLTLEMVRAYLDESLPELPITLIQHAAEMLDKMEELQATTEKRRSAYDAAEKLHRKHKFATMARARIFACEALYTLAAYEHKRKEVQRLERSIKKGEANLSSFHARVKQLDQEALELSGKISALEKSDGIQIAQRLSDTRIQMLLDEENLQRSASARQAATRRREQTEDERERTGDAFRSSQRETIHLLQGMHTSANTEAHWQIASEQILTALERVKALTLEMSQLNLPDTLSSLNDYAISEQMKWLEHLKKLHDELETVSTKLLSAHQQEQASYNKVDTLTRQFKDNQDDVSVAQQELADQLELLLSATTWAHLLPSTEQAVLIWNASLLPAEQVTALTQTLHTYTEAIRQITAEIKQAESLLGEQLNAAHKAQGGKEQQLILLQKVYQQKLHEPEFAPWRTPHREKTRKYLAEEGIQALPFYMLVDFKEEIDSQSELAGGIEDALADAGLLDALAVLPDQSAAMDTYCLAHELNDCRLNIGQISHDQAQQTIPQALLSTLRVDPALRVSLGETAPAWIEYVQGLLASVQTSGTPVQDNLRSWTHGLLTGTIGRGEAQSIGKNTRVRTQRLELARLEEQERLLTEELAELTARSTAIEAERQSLRSLDHETTTLLQESNLSELHATLQATLQTLKQAQTEYTHAQEATRILTQQSQAYKIQLEKTSNNIPIFAADVQKVTQAYEAVKSLRNDHKTLIIYLTNVRDAWKRHQSAQLQLVQDNREEQNALRSKLKDEDIITRIKAELATLEQLASETGGADLATLQQQLTDWKVRQNDLPPELQAANKQETRAQFELEEYQKDYAAAQVAQTQAENEHQQRLQAFHDHLFVYPVEILIEIQQQIKAQPISPTQLQQVLGQALPSGSEAYNTLKSALEKANTKTGQDLSSAFIEANSLLHEYGPHFDDVGIVRFTNAEEVNTYELLMRLEEEIHLQEQLLEAKEYELFQNFLLKEMANTVGARLTDAEAWVERMNTILADSPFMEKRYRLKWVIRPYDPQHPLPGSHLALYRDVLRRQAETFNQEEIEKLVDAFKQEIQIQRAQQATSTATLTEALLNILDYRHWFQFEIDMLHPDNTVQHLTTKFFRSGSGAEQYIALYIPFFTALSALYERAGRGAPRLIALDEAFEKVSAANTKKLLNFLAKQDFQWIMTGPRVTGEGTELPACVKYTMFCHKSDELAAGFPAFWSNDPALAKEVQDKR